MQLPIRNQPSVCGVTIHVVGCVPVASNPAPLLYEWRIYEGSSLKCLYIGKAKNGDSRPLKTYPKVVSDLRQSRNVKKLFSIPEKPYFKRNPWGYRWIHHQLEACIDRILSGNIADERIELHFPKLGIDPRHLHSEEATAIAIARTAFAGTMIVANGMPSMRVQYRRSKDLLDKVWV